MSPPILLTPRRRLAPATRAERRRRRCPPSHRTPRPRLRQGPHLVRRAGLAPHSASCRPRLHDIRHRFAVHTLLDAYRQGHNPEARLALLATYLGHIDPKHTYWLAQDGRVQRGVPLAQRLDLPPRVVGLHHGLVARRRGANHGAPRRRQRRAARRFGSAPTPSARFTEKDMTAFPPPPSNFMRCRLRSG